MLVLKLINHSILRKEHFQKRETENGVMGIYLKQEAKKIFFAQYEQHMLREFTPYKGAVHTNFRKIIEESVLHTIDLLEKDQSSRAYFQMP